ncbi:MAG: VWA domain-containing protein [Candidatus Brocadiae bacterium]|nr:VWA domain-containing protein [Candidatus Brocadiia bacterium]
MNWALDYPWGTGGTWLVAILVVMVLLGSLALVWRQLWPLTLSGIAMVAVRLAALVLLFFLLVQPKRILRKTDEIKPHVAVLLDTSGSMGSVDKNRQTSRLTEALDTLKSARLIESLGAKSKLSVYEFATGLSKLKAEKLGELKKAAGTGTSIGLALAQVRDEFKNEELAGVVLLSDGRDNTGLAPEKAIKQLRAPVYAIGFGRAKDKAEKAKEQDLAVVNVAHDRRVVVGHTTDLTITVASKGFGARTVPVELLLDKDVIASSSVALSPDRPQRQVTMELTPPTPGRFVYTVRVPPDPVEGNKANNEKPVPIYVSDPVLRVLYVEARPRWEFKFVSRVLAAYKNVEHTSVVRFGPGKIIVQGTKPAESALIAQMTPAQLQRLKAIIIGDVPRTFFTPQQLATIAAIVEQGGSVMLLAGKDSFGRQGFGGTALERVLPCQLLARPSYAERRFRVDITPDGQAHPAFQDVKKDWTRAPELISLVGVGELKPGATVLMKTADEGGLPVVIVHRYGRGKAAVVLTDCTWRWKLGMAEGGVKDDLQTVFWRRLITWLMPEQKAEKEKRAVQLVSDKLQYELDEQVSLTVTATDAEGKAARGARVFCHIHAPDGKTIEREAKFGKLPGTGEVEAEAFHTRFVPHVGGKYKVVATAEADGADLGRDELAFLVGDTSIELSETDPDRKLLKALADQSHGRYYEPGDAARIPADIVINTKKHTWTEKKPVWDKWWVFLTFLGLVSIEWILRKSRQLE